MVPYIQSDVIEGPYLRLTVPLVMRSLLPRLEEACPDLTSGSGVGLVERAEREEPADPEYELALIACLSLIWTVRLDSESLEPAWDLHWSRDGKVGGLITYLRADGLSRGAHVLERSSRAPRPVRTTSSGLASTTSAFGAEPRVVTRLLGRRCAPVRNMTERDDPLP